MKKHTLKKGFSLPEVIVAISMIVLVIVTATNLLIASTRANRGNINDIVAYNLAQEAVEGIRNIRDGYWLHNQPWRGDKKLFGSNFLADGFYTININRNLYSPQSCTYDDSAQYRFPSFIERYAPWELRYLGSPNETILLTGDAPKLYLTTDTNSEVKRYEHSSLGGEESGFRRWVEIESLPYEGADSVPGELKIAITAVVEWEELGRTQRVSIPTILTDWKSGPL
ncbi:prepilin-type N-terminal cleavage/methylation domain-containing protein [Patescibacteria group bacterium]